MTTLSVTTDNFQGNTNDAQFRLWGSTVSSHMAAVGLVQSADSGQINWTTVTRPALVNTMAGYEIWKLQDSLFAVAPIYMKLEYGTASSTVNTPAMVASVGTGTDGSGNLTGLISDRRVMNSTNASTVGTYESKACCVEGFFGACLYKGVQGSTGVPLFPFIMCRTMDDSGAFTADGVHLIFGTSGSNAAGMQSLNFISGTKNSYGLTHTLWPSGTTTTLDDSVPPNYQVMRSYQLMPKMRPIGGTCVVYGPEIGENTQFQVAMIGTTPRNFISLGKWFGSSQAAAQSSNFHIAMLWE